MKAALIKELGTPDDIVVETVPTPEPGPGEVRIAIKACGVNFPDVLMVAGKYQHRPDLPFSPGGELSGNIDALGEGVDGLSIGLPVLCVTGFGGMAEAVIVPAKQVVPMPPGMDYKTAAAVMFTYGTSYHALKQRAALAPGETLLVLGAAGGVGLAAVELGKAMGARVIAAASTAEKLALTREHGADETINYTETDLKQAVMELTDGQGADVIYDPVGGELFDACLRSVAWNGRVLVIGFASGEIPKAPANLPLLKGSSIVGVFWGSFTQREPAANAQNMQELVGWFADGSLRPHIGHTFGLEQAGEALKVLASRQAMGKVVVAIDS